MRHRRLAVALAISAIVSAAGATAVAAVDRPQDARDNLKVVGLTSDGLSKSAASSPKDSPRGSPKTAPRVGSEAPLEKVRRLIPDSMWGGMHLDDGRYKVMVTDPSIVPALKAQFSGSMDFVVVRYSLKELDRQMMAVVGALPALQAKGVKVARADGDEVTNTLHVVIEGPVSANARAEILKVVPGAPLRLTSEAKMIDPVFVGRR
jgi:hypothetical protein